jgi:hypothetical protein
MDPATLYFVAVKQRWHQTLGQEFQNSFALKWSFGQNPHSSQKGAVISMEYEYSLTKGSTTGSEAPQRFAKIRQLAQSNRHILSPNNI